MPSFCVIENCKMVKQTGETNSFHKFPNNPILNQEWLKFVAKSNKRKVRKISKYSSICGRHFSPSDFAETQSRKFLKKNAVPSRINPSELNKIDDEPVEIQMEDPLSCETCCLCASSTSTLTIVYEEHINLIRKCLPFTINPSQMQKLCIECIKNMKSFSSFLDKVISAQHAVANLNHENQEVCIKRRIKVEPISNYEEDEKEASLQIDEPQYLNVRPTNQLTSQKKCEILEIVDIKPFNFDSALPQEHFDEDLNPKLKIEITDPDEDGSNELELIRNYVHISTVFLKDHNYYKNEVVDAGVKTEYDDEQSLVETLTTVKICHICCKNFRTIRKYLYHKSVAHRPKNSRRSLQKKSSNLGKTREMCTKIIEQKKRRMVKLSKNIQAKPVQRRRKIYSCPTCHKIFTGPKNLYQHKISHSTSSYLCKICNKMFKRPHGLRQHEKSIHEKVRNHICPVCSYGYLLKADMLKCRHSKLKKMELVQLK